MHNHRHALLHISYRREDLHLVQKSVMLRCIGVSLLELFQPMYLLSSGLSIPHLMLFYGAQYLAAVIIAPFVGHISAQLGFARSMLFGLISFALYLLCFTLAPFTHFATLVPATLLYGLYESVYWPNYHHNFCNLTSTTNRGSETSLITLINAFSRFLAPALAGLTIYFLGFPTLFAFAIVIVLFSAFPFFREQTAEPLTNESAKGILSDLFKSEHRTQNIVFFCLGCIFFMMEIAWPVILFAYFKNLSELGLFVSVIMIISTMVIILLSRIMDRFSKSKILTVGTTLYSLGWILRALIFSKISFFVADLTNRIGENFALIPAYALTYELRERQDKTSFQLQRILMISLGYVISAGLIFFWPTVMLRGILFAAPVFCFVLLLVKRIH